jgi:hypothetical protein
MISYEWRGPIGNAELNALHAEGFGHRLLADDWETQLIKHSLGWVCARDDGQLAGFVNVAWDGGVHAFILDTLVAGAAGCEWLHVDFDDEYLARFYFEGCGFRPTTAGLIALTR